jgi:hypothetical protein
MVASFVMKRHPTRDKWETDMARREVTGKKPGAGIDHTETPPPIRGPPPPRLAFNIPEFCAAFRISEDFYFKLKRQRQGPREMKVGKRTLISVAAADEWRIEREAASKAKAKTTTKTEDAITNGR